MLDKGQPQRFNAYNSPHEDLREFIKRAEEAGEIVRIKGADWKLEMGTLGEIVNHMRPGPPALLFEDVPGYPEGMRLISGATNSSKRLALDMGLPVPLMHLTGGQPVSIRGKAEIVKLNDHHGYLKLNGMSLAVGDRIAVGISHPCTTFDRWKYLYVVNDQYDVVSVVQTFF